MNLALWLARAAKAYPNDAAIAHGTTISHDYRRFARRVANLAGGLVAMGMQRGDRCAIASRNRVEYLEALYAIWWAGLAAVPINARLHEREIAWVVEQSGARCIFVSEPHGGTYPDTEILSFDASEYHRLVEHDAIEQPVSCLGDELAWLFYTSGTTGQPKGAMLTHRNLMAMSLAYLTDVNPSKPGQGIIHAAPMSHGSGLYMMPHVGQRGINIVPESSGFDAAELAELLANGPACSMFAAPTMINRLVAAQIDFPEPGFHSLIWGGAPMHVPDIIRALHRFGPCLVQIYGQGETPMTGSVLAKSDIADRNHPRWTERLGSAGITNSAVELRIDGAVGEIGEVLIRGDTVMKGYWRNAEASRAAIKDGWLYTGDIGSIDTYGYLTLRDRSKDVIISGGTNIYPREVEEALLRHPALREVSVIGRPDPQWGEIVVAYVVGDTTQQELDAVCGEAIARFKRPKSYVFVESLPKNNYGKILKKNLRDLDGLCHSRDGD